MQCKSDTQVIQMYYKPDQNCNQYCVDQLYFFVALCDGSCATECGFAIGPGLVRSPTHKIETGMQIVIFPERNDTLTGHHSFCEIKKLGHIVINLLITGWRTECGLLKKSWLGKSLAIDSSKFGADHTPSSSSFINKLITMWSSLLRSQNEW